MWKLKIKLKLEWKKSSRPHCIEMALVRMTRSEYAILSVCGGKKNCSITLIRQNCKIVGRVVFICVFSVSRVVAIWCSCFRLFSFSPHKLNRAKWLAKYGDDDAKGKRAVKFVRNKWKWSLSLRKFRTISVYHFLWFRKNFITRLDLLNIIIFYFCLTGWKCCIAFF